MAVAKKTSKKAKKKTPTRTARKRVKTGSAARSKKTTRGRSTSTTRRSAAKSARKMAKTRKTVKARKTATKSKKAATRAKAVKRTATRRAAARPAKNKAKAGSRAQSATRRRAAGSNGAPAKAGTGRPSSGLSAKDLEVFRSMLLEKRAQLLGDVSTLRREARRGSRQDAAGELSTMPIHMAELGTDNYELEFTLRLVEDGRALLGEIDEALDRINNGTYGICLATGKPIGKARLRAKPWAKYCYEYVLAQETGQQR